MPLHEQDIAFPVSHPLTSRTNESEAYYNIKAMDAAFFHPGRPVIVGRSGTGHFGISLEYSHSGGRNWQIVSFHETVAAAIDAFRDLGLGKDRGAQHYRILKES